MITPAVAQINTSPLSKNPLITKCHISFIYYTSQNSDSVYQYICSNRIISVYLILSLQVLKIPARLKIKRTHMNAFIASDKAAH